MMMYDYDGQRIFGDLVGLKLPDIRLTGEETPKNLTQETCEKIYICRFILQERNIYIFLFNLFVRCSLRKIK